MEPENLSLADVRAALEPDELDYDEAASDLGPAALPLLEQLLAGADVGIATKATYLAGLMAADATRSIRDQSNMVLQVAAGHGDPRVRIAAAAAAEFLGPELAEPLLKTLQADADAGVRFKATQVAGRVLRFASTEQ